MTPNMMPRPNGLTIRPNFPGMGGNGIMGFLQPLLSHINQDYQQDTVQPYVQQVEDLTRTTFPDVEFNRQGPRFPFQPGGGFPGLPGVGNPMPKPFPPGFGQGAPGILGLLGQQTTQQAQPVGLGGLR
jgi:hypothetical protein